MQRISLFILFVAISLSGNAQKNKYDSIKKVLQQDSIEYEQYKRNAEQVKQQTDSMMRQELGHVETITPVDTAEVRKKMRQIAEQEFQRREAEEKKNYYIYVGVFAFLTIAVIWLFKRKQFSEANRKKP